jgi:peptidoglycan/LPS O-acetylase OafA/YrhL
VAAVVLYHAEVTWMPGGFLGVDAFFVLSGFLITSLLVAERDARGAIDLASFWARRARRLLPAMLLLVAGVSLYAAVAATDGELSNIRRDGLASLLYVNNWVQIQGGATYFDQFLTASPLRHVWSLAIEEQWYLVWPVVVGFTLHRRLSHLGLVVITAGLMVASAVWMATLFEPGSDPTRAYYGTDTRAQGLLAGALVALVLSHPAIPGARAGTSAAVRDPRPLRAAGAAAGAWLVWMVLRGSDSSPWLYEGGFLVVSLAVAVVVAAVAHPSPSGLSELLSGRPLRALGRVSYGVYLWHWPVFVVVNRDRVDLAGHHLLALRLTLTLAVAVLSYRLLEMPVRTRSWPRWPAPRALATAMTGVAVLVLVGTVGAVSTAPAVLAHRLEAPEVGAVPATAPTGQATPPPADAAGPVRVLWLGDSVSWTLGRVHPEQPGPDDAVAVWNRAEWYCELVPAPRRENGRTLPPSEGCPDWRSSWARDVETFDPQVVALHVGAWEVFDRRIGGRWVPFGSAESDALLLETLDDVTELATARGARLALLTVPLFERSPGVSATEWTQNEHWRTRHLNDLLRRHAADHPELVSVVELGRWVCPGDRCRDEVDGSALRYDGVHFSPEGAAVAASWLAPRLAELARR